MRIDRAWIAPLAVALVLRLAYLAGAWNVAPIADEETYLEQARHLAQFGVYTGRWAPGNAALLALLTKLCGESAAPQAGRVVQVLLSLPLALSTMAVARAIFGARAARLAGWIYAFSAPLLVFTHTLWPETPFLALFVPALFLLLEHAQRANAAATGRPAAAGVLLGLALLFKESALYLVLPIAIWLCVLDRAPLRRGLASAAAFALGVLVIVLPWTLRNHAVYGHFVPVGLTRGINAGHGLAPRYTNFDHPGLPLERVYPPESLTHRLFLADAPPTWKRSQEPNVAEKDADDFQRGLAFAAAHPLWFARTRVVKLADFLTPLSFLVRGYRMRTYAAPVDSAVVRRVAVAWNVLSVPLAMLATVLALTRRRCARGARALVWIVLLYFLATGLLVAMSRYRAPIEPLFVACAAGFLGGEQSRASRAGRITLTLALAVLSLAWLAGWPALRLALEQAW